MPVYCPEQKRSLLVGGLMHTLALAVGKEIVELEVVITPSNYYRDFESYLFLRKQIQISPLDNVLTTNLTET